jgi:hypothetical protein
MSALPDLSRLTLAVIADAIERGEVPLADALTELRRRSDLSAPPAVVLGAARDEFAALSLRASALAALADRPLTRAALPPGAPKPPPPHVVNVQRETP